MGDQSYTVSGMPRAQSHSLSNLTPSQRWTAAMRLADGDPPVLAAALADASPDRLERLLAENAGFNELVHACRALLDLPDDAWLERMRHLVGQLARASVFLMALPWRGSTRYVSAAEPPTG